MFYVNQQIGRLAHVNSKIHWLLPEVLEYSSLAAFNSINGILHTGLIYMGSEVIAKCKCGVEASILIGGGMLNFKTTFLFPCICENCHAVVQVNLLAKRKQCPKCKSTQVIPYDNPTLSGRTGKCVVTSWNMRKQLGRELTLTNANYRCPQCGKMTLHFADSGLQWD